MGEVWISINLKDNGEYYEVRWTVGKRTEARSDSFTPMHWHRSERLSGQSEGDMLYINGARFAKAYQELEEDWWSDDPHRGSRLYSRCE